MIPNSFFSDCEHCGSEIEHHSYGNSWLAVDGENWLCNDCGALHRCTVDYDGDGYYSVVEVDAP